ncbi:DMT family transporter [Alicyclobacillus sp. SO9]|uniref:DMT family transporter n=1 Tax=Alicyclobacillus sp. SO9 TaxID=2665646 RepID=UPI0018E71C40|nr:DMT family transporter [Alicyclobacillus sp. SO9]QQE77639.1 DMT family transporter [Alicyclobacillus sp. SO9]
MKPNRLFANTTLLLITVVWGATFTLTKDALQTVHVFPFLTIRFFLATLVLLLIALMSGPSRTALLRKSTWFVGAALGLSLFLAYGLQTLGLSTTGAAVSGFLTGLNVVLVPILSIPFLRHLPSLRIWIGVALAVIGLALLSGYDLLLVKPGDIYVLMCALFLALQILLVEKWGNLSDSLALAVVELGVVAAGSLFSSIVSSHSSELFQWSPWFRPSVLWPIMINAVFGTSLAYWAQNVFQKYTGSAQIALIFSMEPVFAAIVAWLFLDEQLSVLGWIGGACIFLSMLIADPGISLRRLRMKKLDVHP